MKNELTVPTGTKFQLEIEDNDGTMKTCFLKSISRPIMERALGLIMPITGAPKLITADEIRKMSALIRFHFKINPDDLSDSDFSRTWNDLRYCLDFENKRNALDMP